MTTRVRDFKFFPVAGQRPYLVMVALSPKRFCAQYGWFCHGGSHICRSINYYWYTVEPPITGLRDTDTLHTTDACLAPIAWHLVINNVYMYSKNTVFICDCLCSCFFAFPMIGTSYIFLPGWWFMKRVTDTVAALRPAAYLTVTCH